MSFLICANSLERIGDRRSNIKHQILIYKLCKNMQNCSIKNYGQTLPQRRSTPYQLTSSDRWPRQFARCEEDPLNLEVPNSFHHRLIASIIQVPDTNSYNVLYLVHLPRIPNI